MYTLDSGVLKLDLGATAPNPAGLNNRQRFPVWRVLFLKPNYDATASALTENAFTKAYADVKNRFRYSYQIGSEASGLKWELYSGIPAAEQIATPEIDRVLWFADLDPTTNNHGLPSTITQPEDRIFTFAAGKNKVAGGQYLVVGPRPITYMGSKPRANPPVNTPSNHRFQLVDGWLQIWDQENRPTLWAQGTPVPLVANNTPTPAGNNAPFNDRIRDCVTMTAAMLKPSAWTDPQTNSQIGLNISEPTRDQYYQEPTQYLNANDTGTFDPDTNAPGFGDLPKDAYIDLDANTGTPPAPLDSGAVSYLRANHFPTTGPLPSVATQQHWSAAVLQRLADPARPYHEQFNPYITVDWMSIDLTVFSGEETISPPGDLYLCSRQKTGAVIRPWEKSDQPNFFGSTFYSYHTNDLEKSSPLSSSGQPYFDFELTTELYTGGGTLGVRNKDAKFSTLGFLNPTFFIRGTGPAQTPAVPAVHDYTFPAYFRGAPGPNWAGPGGTLLLAPRAPYIPNRDFVNAYELMNVPLSSPGQFMQDFVFDSDFLPSFKHVLDFEDLLLPNPPTPPNLPAIGKEHSTSILFECVGVRSPWVDAWKLCNPAATNARTSSISEIYQTHLFANYRPPYNTIPTFREPGRINLNTITEPNVFRGLMWNMMTPTNVGSRASATVPYQSNLTTSRNGYARIQSPAPTRVLLSPNPQLNNRAATEFLGVFTSPVSPYGFVNNDQRTSTAAAMTILRDQGTPGTRLFTSAENGVFPATNLGQANTFVANYPVQRMANLTTNRSNVYSVRMTLGYFEYDPSTADIGQEYGVDQGLAVRHRAFYMLDRSIPVGYQQGYDLNTGDCIIARSIIE